MDKLPVAPSPHRFLLPNSKSKTKAEPLQHQARQPSPAYHLKNPNAVPASSASVKTPTAPNLTLPSKTKVVDPRTRARTTQRATGTEFGGRTNDGFGVGAEPLAAGRGNGMDAGTTEGRASDESRALNAVGDDIWKGGKPTDNQAEMPAAKQMQTPRGNQFKAAPKFRFGGSQKHREVSPSVAESGLNATPKSAKPRWRATQTPLRQSLSRELTEEEIVDAEEVDMLKEDVRESVERQDLGVDVDVDEEEYSGVTFSQLDAETPVPKRRRVNGDPVESFSYSRSQQDDAPSYDQGCAEADSIPQADRLERDYDTQNDKEMLYNDDQEPQEVQPPLQDLSHPILSIHHPPATTAPTQFQRPRFILPTSHPPRLSTPEPHSTQQVFAPTPNFVVTTPSQAPTHHDNVPKFATPFAPVPHFFIPTPTYSNPLPDEPQFTKPPKFVHIEEPEPTQPLPEEFSPKKRGQKFVVGGLAGEVRGWLIDLETQNQGSTVRAVRGDGGDGECMVKMVVEEVNAKGGGFTIAKGDGLNVILGGMGMSDGLQKTKEVVKGSVVGIKAPVWEVEIQGMRWDVGANWRAWER